jgi:hypothetical protein
MKLAHISLQEINFIEYIAELCIEMPVALSDTIQDLPGYTKMWPRTISKSMGPVTSNDAGGVGPGVTRPDSLYGKIKPHPGLWRT